ncbi:MAG TPA: TonB-dependent receptor plug domain-containing protein, partial [Rhodanobacter sp.]|nr:TonB-dependent receptor plug domain-containing protein [Rhodanobacter sp.]
MTQYRKYLVATISALLYGAYVPNTHAQSKGEDPAATTTLEAVNVKATGTHIKGITLSGVGPVTVIDAEAIERSGASSIDVLLQRMPSSAGTAGNQSNAYWTGDGWGTSQVSLRGLGPGRTLVLLNGRRIVNGGSGANSSVDLNTIPVSMIERIEVLKDGASAIYGADAVAGVVNIITKRGFKGVSLSAKYGQTFKNDGADVATDLTWGSTSERGSMMAGLSYSEGKKVSMDSRAPCALGEVSGSLQCVGSSSTIGGRARLADGRIVNFNQDPNGDPNSYHTYSSKDNYNSNPYLNLVNPIKRLSVAAFGDYAITENIKMFSELLYSNRRSNQLATPGTLGVFRTINIAANHPTNPTGQDLVLQRRRLQEGGPRIAFQDVDTFRAVLGLEGKLGAGWEWGVSANYGRNTAVDG